MQFIDLHAQYDALKERIDKRVADVLDRSVYIGGSEIAELEANLAEYVGVEHCIACANGTDALELSLLAWGIGAGDAVFVPSFTFMSTAEVVSYLGAVPVFVDVNEKTYNMDPVSLDQAIAAVEAEGRLRPAAVIPVDLFGQPADYAALLPLAARHGLKVLEDGAQGFGGLANGKRACGFGELSTTSFFPAKPLGCYGDGGAIFTDDDELDALLRSLRVHGKGSQKYDNVRIGRNSRLDTLQAAILLEKLEAFKENEFAARNRVAMRYTEKLRDVVTTPFVPQGVESSWAQYTIMLPSESERDSLQAYLKEKGVPSMVYYPRPLHLQTAFASVRTWGVPLSVSEEASRRVLSLPMHPYLSAEDLDQVVRCVIDWKEARS